MLIFVVDSYVILDRGSLFGWYQHRTSANWFHGFGRRLRFGLYGHQCLHLLKAKNELRERSFVVKRECLLKCKSTTIAKLCFCLFRQELQMLRPNPNAVEVFVDIRTQNADDPDHVCVNTRWYDRRFLLLRFIVNAQTWKLKGEEQLIRIIIKSGYWYDRDNKQTVLKGI